MKQGVPMVPSRIARAAAPWPFGPCLDWWQTGALWVSSGLRVIGFLSLLALHTQQRHLVPTTAAAFHHEATNQETTHQ